MAKKNANNEGTIFFDNSKKKWYASLFDPVTSIRLKSKGNVDREVVSNWLTMQKASIINNTFVSPTDLTLGDWVLEYLNTFSKPNVKPKTFERYVHSAAKLECIAHLKLQEVNSHTIQKMLNSLPDSLSSSSKNKVYKVLSMALNQALASQLIHVNPIKSIKPPKVTQEEVQIFTREEIEKIIKILPIKTRCQTQLANRYPFVLLAITTGARLGELLGLRWEDLDKTTGTIYIRRSIQQLGTKLIVETPKTVSSTRKISIPVEVVAELLKHRQKQSILELDGSDYIFCTRNSKNPISPSNANKFWHSILKHCDVEYKKFHCLRHTHATELLAAGVPIIEVSRRLGHSKPSHTLNMYGHSIPAYNKIMLEKIKSVYNL